MRFVFLIPILFVFHCHAFSQNISVDKIKHEIIGMGSVGDTTVYLTKFKEKDSLIYPVFYKRDTLLWSGKTFFHVGDFDSITQRMYSRGNKAPLTGFLLRKKAKIKLKKEFSYRVGMMPTFGWYVGKKKPGRHQLVGYRVKIYSEGGLSHESIVYYHFQKQSFFKRFFKKRRVKKRFKKLPVLSGAEGPQVIYTNAIIEEGGQMRNLYYSFYLKEDGSKQNK